MKVIVDDRDLSIFYSSSPAWSTHWPEDGHPLGRPEEYAGTTSQPVQGATASFTFTGTQITVFATLASINSSDLFVECGIDGRVLPILPTTTSASDSPPFFHRPVFISDALTNGQHTLVMKGNSPSQSSLYFDYIIYETDARRTSTTGLIDDADTTNVVFSATQWRLDNTPLFMQQTSRYTGQAGGWVTVKYEFQDGDILSLFGTLGSQDQQFASQGSLSASVWFDDGQPVYLPSQNAPPPGQMIVNQKLYFSPPLTAGTHTFKFTYNAGTPLGVDYFLVEAGPPADTSSGGSSQGGSNLGSITDVASSSLGHPGLATSLTRISVSTNILPTRTSLREAPTTAPVSSPARHDSHAVPLAPVFGAVGSIVVLLICIWVILWLQRRHAWRMRQLRPVPLDLGTVEPMSRFRSKRALAGERQTTFHSRVQDPEEALNVAGSSLPTEELVRILNSRLQNVVLDEQEEPPSYPEGMGEQGARAS